MGGCGLPLLGYRGGGGPDGTTGACCWRYYDK